MAATEEEAAEAYDIAAIKFRGSNAVTNFEMNRYDVDAIQKSSLPIGGAAKRLKISFESEQKPVIPTQQLQGSSTLGSNLHFSAVQGFPHQPIPCGIPFDSVSAYYHPSLFQHLQVSHASVADPAGTTAAISAPPMTAMSPAEFFLWPHHQSY